MTQHGVNNATTDPEQILAWWTKQPQANIGLRVGEHHAVFDVDPRKGSLLTWSALLATYAPVTTLTANSGGVGQHLFCRLPAGCSITGRSDALGPGVDVITGNKYVVAAPSIHPNGRTYTWENDLPIADFPLWAYLKLNQTAQTPPTPKVKALSQPAHRTPHPPIRSTTYWGEGMGVVDSSKRTDLDLALARLLGIDRPVGSKFLCLLHDEKDPSAWLFWGKGGDLLYHCEHHGGLTLNIPTVRACLCEGRLVRLRGARQHQEHRLFPLLAAGLIKLPLVLHMPLPVEAPKAAKAWYNAFIWSVAFNQLAFPGNLGTMFSRRFAVAVTGLSDRDEQAAAKWLLRHGYVRKAGSYRAYGKDCKLLSLGPGPRFEEAEDFDLLEEEGKEAIHERAA